MTSLFTLLTLPQTSNGFTALRVTARASDSPLPSSATPTASAQPQPDRDARSIRKVPRLDKDSDSASASRSRAHTSGIPTGPIKIEIIGNYVDPPPPEDAHFALIRRCTRIILTHHHPEVIPTTYESIYNACRSLVTISNKGEGLYSQLMIELEQCTAQLRKTLTQFEARDPVEWITQFVGVCEWFGNQIHLLTSLLTYLDQVYVLRTPKIKRIHDLAFGIFNDTIFDNPILSERLRGSIESWVSYERSFRLNHAQRAQIPLLINQLNAYDQYSSFEFHYLSLIKTFYTNESTTLAKEMKADAPSFFAHMRARLEEEIARAREVLPVSSWRVVRKATEEALWDGRIEWLANETMSKYMANKEIDTLGSMYTLFSRVEGTKALCTSFKKYLQTSVQEIVKDQAQDENMVQRLLDLKALADHTISTAFVDEPEPPLQFTTSKPAPPSPVPSDPIASTSAAPPKLPNKDFVYALSDAFSLGFKARRSAPAEQIAKYLDRAMRKGQGSMSDVAYEAELDRVLGLYRFTEDKDVFRTFYHRALAKRLLLARSASDDFEKGMVRKLKEKYDPEFGMGEDMFKDLALSRDSMREYYEKLGPESSGRKLGVMVLQRSAWPFSVPKTSVDLPPSMQADLTAYADYYKARHSGHVLDWDHALGTATLVGRFMKGNKELSVSLYQAVVLLLFNTPENGEVSFTDIKASVGIDDAELRRTLQSLACGKKKVLRKIPVGRDVEDGDAFRFNKDFEDPRAKVHINSIQAKVTPEESKRTNLSIEGDRKHYLDAAIVRVMKARKEMTFEQLKMATIDAVKGHFVPSVDQIKKRIDSLVESDYLERSKEDRNRFIYLA
ncbi:hypothetical protein AMATHDRAFT_82846 [Amanita thiersii Skay4041]|uniref:Cullin family profile domain-containing protein n=1 Tax=Amanita thiersii Skay4041 TaxID=703135 RepID=A0A2A9NBE1_9AGAR|nr:hypothetical protein AMATHDRAFT_82846 [Amanita thiersii Skay4041]